ncbi:MAG: SpoIID/LytB domain-containing protein [Ruminococcus sp.]|nr:SpoIID/LytB domain-containing protein [Ruminococcus sp.]
MVILPVVGLIVFNKPETEQVLVNTETENIYTVPETIKVRDNERVYNIAVKDYVISAVMATMPVSFHEEALKAQAAAIHTTVIRETVKNAERDFDIDSGFMKTFTEARGRAFYTDGYEAAYEKIAAAVDETLPYVIMYESEPIAAAFFSCSAGLTENTDIPYLKSVESYETDSRTAVTFTEAEMKARIETELDIAFGEIEILERSEAKTVIKMKIGSQTLTGQTFKNILNLKSAAFYISEDNGIYTITTLGQGSFIGMSQYGAEAMAQSGSSWQEIIEHYYTNVKIIKVRARNFEVTTD